MKYVKRFANVLLGAAFIFGLAACGEKAPKGTDVTIEFEEKSVQVVSGESVVLKLRVTPESEASKVVWTSSNPDVGTVDNQGKVTAKVVGKTEVKAAIGDKSAVCQVVVKAAGKMDIGEKLGIGDKPFALNVENCIQYVWDYKTDKKITYKGDKPAIIDFWATWCAPCKRIAPFLDELAKEYNGKAYVFKVELGGGGSPLKEEAAIFKAVMAAPNNPGFDGYIPAFLLLPSDGSAPKSVIGVGAGSSTEDALRKFFEEEVAKAK